MLSLGDNEILTRTGPGTLMGALLRRYWVPACLSEEIAEPDSPPIRVKLLGESLVGFRDTNGEVGLLDELCPHRGTSLFFGRNEESGLRCVYHGWKFDHTGQCVDQRSEIHSFANRIKAHGYPTHESGGIVWTYMGPAESMPVFRDFGTETIPKEAITVSKEFLACNWVQALDGELDSAHISNLHSFNAMSEIPPDGTDEPGYPSNFESMRFWAFDPKPRLEIDETWYGFRYAGLRKTPNGHTHVRVTACVLPFSALIASIPFGTRQIAVIPRDDVTALRYTFATQPPSNPRDLGGPAFFKEPKYPYIQNSQSGVLERPYTLENDYQIDRDTQRAVSFSGIPNFKSQDLMATESAGPIYDRTLEHLGGTDTAVAHYHDLLINAAKDLALGKEPPAIADHLDYREIRSAEKVLAPDEDWRLLGTSADPIVQEALLTSEQEQR
jgi:phthalate 4,5-dioxygenase oxygenase subunit